MKAAGIDKLVPNTFYMTLEDFHNGAQTSYFYNGLTMRKVNPETKEIGKDYLDELKDKQFLAIAHVYPQHEEKDLGEL